MRIIHDIANKYYLSYVKQKKKVQVCFGMLILHTICTTNARKVTFPPTSRLYSSKYTLSLGLDTQYMEVDLSIVNYSSK